MPNLRIVSDNAIERATLTASSTAGGLAVGNLAAPQVYPVWRATARDAWIAAAFDSPEPIGFFGLFFCDLSPTAQMRVRISGEQAATNLLKYSEAFDNASWVKSGGSITATNIASPDGNAVGDEFTSTTADGYFVQSLNAVAVAGVAYVASVWMKSTAARNVIIVIRTGGVTISRACAVTTAWQRFEVTSVADTNGVLSLQIGGAGTLPTGAKVHLFGAQAQRGTVADSYFPTTNAAATRPTGHIDTWQSYDYDSGLVLACPAPAVRLRGFTPAQAASAYAYGGGAYARHWLPAEVLARAMVVDIHDPDNLQGYIEAGCMVAGPFWSLTYNASAASVTVVDRTEITRSAAGGQLADPGTMSRKVPVDLRAMPPADRAKFLNLVRNSRAHPILLSVFPMHADAELERDFMVYGRRTKDSDLAYQFMNAYATTLEVEEI